jgi:hypothetical protein
MLYKMRNEYAARSSASFAIVPVTAKHPVPSFDRAAIVLVVIPDEKSVQDETSDETTRWAGIVFQSMVNLFEFGFRLVIPGNWHAVISRFSAK